MKTFINSLSILALILVFSACQKENNMPLPATDPEPETSSLASGWQNDTNCRVDNANNPYDQVGALHNDYIADLEARYNAQTPLADLYGAIDHDMQRDYGSQLPPGFSAADYGNTVIQAMRVDAVGAYIDALETTAEQKVLLKKLLQIMYTYESTPLCEVIDAIRNFENSLLQRYAPKRIQAVLVAASVGRYSLAYWDDRLQNGPSSAWNWRKIFTAVADGIGAAGGAVAGSATVVGGIAGGLMGGISASVGFSRVWDIFS